MGFWDSTVYENKAAEEEDPVAKLVVRLWRFGHAQVSRLWSSSWNALFDSQRALSCFDAVRAMYLVTCRFASRCSWCNLNWALHCSSTTFQTE